MSQPSRPHRVGDQIRAEVGRLITHELRDPGLGFVTVTHVHVSADLQAARIYYTVIGDERGRRETGRALERALPFIRRKLGSRLRLRRVPELTFTYDESIAREERIEQLMQEIRATAVEDPAETPAGTTPDEPARTEGDDGGE